MEDKLRPSRSEKPLLRRLNETQITGERLMKFAAKVQALPKRERDFEGRAIAAIQFFSRDPDAVLSACFRMEALAFFIAQGVPGWASETDARGAVRTHRALFEAAGRAPLVSSGGEIRFRRSSFLRIAFQEAKSNS